MQTSEVLEMNPNQAINCVAVKGSTLVVGIGDYDPLQSEPLSGYLHIYCLEGQALNLKSSQRTAEITALGLVTEKSIIFGCVDTLVYAKLTNHILEEIYSESSFSYIQCIDTYNNVLVVADMFKLLRVYAISDTELSVIASSYSAHWPTAVKLISDKEMLLSDAFGHILLYQTNEDQAILPIGGYYCGELVNCFRAGSLVPQMSEGLFKDLMCYLFATTKGSLGVIASLQEREYLMLNALQEVLSGLLPQSPNLNLRRFRQPDVRGSKVDWSGFLDGDFIEEFLKLLPNQQFEATKQVNEKLHTEMSVQVLQSLVLTLSTIH